jgi:signal transduction histidine kinase
VVDGDKDTLRLEVIDDGCGIAPERLSGTNPRLGITAMRERAGAIGAHVALHGMHGGGTRVQLRWSLEEGAHEHDLSGR